MHRLSVRALLDFHPKAVLATIVASATVLVALAWGALTLFDYVDTLNRAERDARQAAALLEGHAASMLADGAGAVARAADRMRDGGLSALAEPASWEALDVPPHGILSVVDADGRTVFGSTLALDGAGPDQNGLATDAASNSEADTASGAGDGGIVMLHGRADGVESIVLARRLRDRLGRAAGAVLLAIPEASLSTVLTLIGDGGHQFAGLFRPDGGRLAGVGPQALDPQALGPLPRLEPGDGRGDRHWLVGGQPAVLGFKRMLSLPAVAVVAMPREVALAPWLARLEQRLSVAGVGCLAMIGLAWLGWASLRREEETRTALRDANARLEQRVEQRTADLRALNQKLIRALSEKERADQAKSRFLSAANHDLRQPFQALRLFHHLLTERLKDPRDRSIADRMGEALDSGEKLLHSLLEVATLDAGVVRPNVADVPVAMVLAQLEAEFRAAAGEKGLGLRVRACDAVVRTDATLLTRMLRDLVRNALAYTPMGGVVIGCRRRGQWLRMEVWDTGAGIPAEQLDAIFEDFVQLGNPERDRRNGLGLGLSKVRRKAALLGHALEVRSRPGKGSVFSVTVPLAASGATEETPPSSAAGQTAEAKAARLILVVEDDPVQRAGMRLLLESWGHDVLAAADGPAALDALRAAPRCPDAILTDFRLPGLLTGADTVTRAGHLMGRPVPGIILTGDTAPERIREAVAAGCRLLHKPFAPDVLRDALNAVGSERGAPRHVRQTAA